MSEIIIVCENLDMPRFYSTFQVAAMLSSQMILFFAANTSISGDEGNKSRTVLGVERKQ